MVPVRITDPLRPNTSGHAPRTADGGNRCHRWNHECEWQPLPPGDETRTAAAVTDNLHSQRGA